MSAISMSVFTEIRPIIAPEQVMRYKQHLPRRTIEDDRIAISTGGQRQESVVNALRNAVRVLIDDIGHWNER
jgi:hypothetical protein